jgi:UDP-N-acetylglucosamine--N-acetylmuramyl-(pentapeptide) pyrophosphoryl-undecaprenol N-acetylglucosamine transferase
MPETYAHASLFVCRAGAVTCAELTTTGTPSILVPLPGAPADHQTRNAETLASEGAAVMLRDAELDGMRLDAELTALLADEPRLGSMGEAARALGRPDATERVADLVEQTAKPVAAPASGGAR